MKVGFWMRDFHVLQTAVHVTMDFIGRRTKTLVRISWGRESNIDKLSGIAFLRPEKQWKWVLNRQMRRNPDFCFSFLVGKCEKQNESKRKTHFTWEKMESESTRRVVSDVKHHSEQPTPDWNDTGPKLYPHLILLFCCCEFLFFESQKKQIIYMVWLSYFVI